MQRKTGSSLKKRSPGEVRVARASIDAKTYQEINVMGVNISVNQTEHNAPSGLVLSVNVEIGKQYCAKLLKVLLRHSQPAEVEQIVSLLEAQASRQIASRYNPGLNDATYDLYRRTWLPGGVA